VSRHHFTAISFAENLAPRDLAAAFPECDRGAHGVRWIGPGQGVSYVYPFGAMVFQDLDATAREAALARLLDAFPHLTRVAGEEDLNVVEDADASIAIADGTLTIDRLLPRRASLIALTLAQSAAMEYYEEMLDGMFARTTTWVERLERSGTAPLRSRTLHRFIAAAITVRTEVFSVLHLLDKPDEVWEDPTLDAIYSDLRAEFDLGDRFQALELALRSVQESLELVLDIVRDRRMVLLETAILVLIAVEIAMSLLRL
jgi:uncharacterized Rmd1/YagE family protein